MSQNALRPYRSVSSRTAATLKRGASLHRRDEDEQAAAEAGAPAGGVVPRPEPDRGGHRHAGHHGPAAHLPGMVASMSPLPVIGVPVKSSNSIDGWDSVLSILQMPGGVPVATVALNGAKNAGILAAQILGSHDKVVLAKIMAYKLSLKDAVNKAAENLKK